MTIKELFAPSDMTVGKPWEKIVIFTIPMLIGNIAQQLYNTVDSIVIGKYVGDNALAAVGSASPILNLLLVLFVGISVGAGVMVSQYFGARQREELSMTIGNCVTLTAISSLIIMFLGAVLSRPLLEMLHTPDSIIDWCTSYLVILMVGCMGSAYYNIFCGILRGLGDSISALIYLLVATVLNIILDIVFVSRFQMGVAGVAYATVIAQAVSAILCFWKLLRMTDIFDFKFRHLKMKKKYTLEIIRLGLPSGITQAIFSMAMVIVQSLTNSFGEMVIAANVIIMRVDRVEQGARQGTAIALGTSAVITLLILVFGKNLMAIFTDTSELVTLSANMMKILAVGYLAMAITQSLSGVMRGAGDTMTPMWISMITTVVIRVPLAYGLAFLTRTPELPNGRYQVLWISLLVCWCMGALLTFLFYKKGNWKKKALTADGNSDQ